MAYDASSTSSIGPDTALQGADVLDSEGMHATLFSVRRAEDGLVALLHTDQGCEIQLPASLLQAQQNGAYRIPVAYRALTENDSAAVSKSIVQTIPVLQEELQVGKRTIDTGKGVRLHKSVREREHIVDQPLRQDELVVEHTAVGKILEAGQQPATRYEGDTLVVPVLEEVLIVEKRIRLKEEIRITLHRRETHARQKVALRSEEISIEAFDESRSDSGMQH